MWKNPLNESSRTTIDSAIMKANFRRAHQGMTKAALLVVNSAIHYEDPAVAVPAAQGILRQVASKVRKPEFMGSPVQKGKREVIDDDESFKHFRAKHKPVSSD